MKFIDKINNIAQNNPDVKMFIDMDGTISEFIFDIEESFAEDRGYLKKKPIVPIIEQINNIHTEHSNIELFILSCSRTEQMAKEKDEWIDKYIPYIAKENRIYLIKEKGGYSNENIDIVKSEYIKSILNNNEIAIIIDDDNKILRQAQKILKEKVFPFHVTSLLI